MVGFETKRSYINGHLPGRAEENYVKLSQDTRVTFRLLTGRSRNGSFDRRLVIGVMCTISSELPLEARFVLEGVV
jgi:hypothetical protein